MKCLGGLKETLPPEAVEAIEQLQLSNTQDTTKELHRAVAAQSAAKKQLIQTRAARAAYIAAWNEYIAQVSDLIQKQVQEQAAQLAHYDETEVAWQGALEKATSDLARMANVSTSSAPDEESEMEIAEAQVDNDIETSQELERRRQQQVADSAKLMEVMASLKEVRCTEAGTRELGNPGRVPDSEATKTGAHRPHQGEGGQAYYRWAATLAWATATAICQGAPWWGQCVSFRGPHWPIESGLPHLAVNCEYNFMYAHVAELHACNQALEVRLQDLPGLRPHTFLDDTRFDISELEPWEDRFPLARTRDIDGPGLMAKRVTFAESNVEPDCIDAASCAVQLFRTGPGILHIFPHRLPLQVMFKEAGGNSSGNQWRRQFSQLCGGFWESSRTTHHLHCSRPWSQPVQVYPCTANVHLCHKQLLQGHPCRSWCGLFPAQHCPLPTPTLGRPPPPGCPTHPCS